MGAKAVKSRSLTSHYKKRFLQHYRELCVIGKAAEATGITRRAVELWREKDSEFRALFESAKQDVVEMLEAEAIRRAYHGIDKPIYHLGRPVGVVREFSDTLLIFLLKSVDPNKYRERHEVTGEGGKPIEVKVTAGDLTDEELAVIAATNIIRNNAARRRAGTAASEVGAEPSD